MTIKMVLQKMNLIYISTFLAYTFGYSVKV